eukprot:CAMPEP_0183747878 /NCGR_PEP_ID=MMETSP0737-20130205/67487_1 /TAXON_ID=385413 /ORGANISM="Thalassiosira miniscula, Strain CCMP1093" /LENGTH=461 /DNA_ID=CAMNT_0025983595 /DNA_START=574 /DNA_END=1959 /DNA_ORIENTATION=+
MPQIQAPVGGENQGQPLLTQTPIKAPTQPPTNSPTELPTEGPTALPPPPPPPPAPTNEPSKRPSSSSPTSGPTGSPSKKPSNNPTTQPSQQPTKQPSGKPTAPAGTQRFVPTPACPNGFTCLQNGDYGSVDSDNYNVNLSLEMLNPDNADAYVKARAKWSQIITGDVSDFKRRNIPSNSDPEVHPCLNRLPPIVDDVHICGLEAAIDGEGKVLGIAGPMTARADPATGLYTTITGLMRFDIADIERLVAQGRYESVILHEMGHVLGVGTLWRLNKIVNAQLVYRGPNAKRVWKEDWGCASDAPPLETDGGAGTAGGHWDEDCLQDEFMTGYVDKNMPISRLTIASLEDLGYVVNYNAADRYDGSDTTCCNPPSRALFSAQQAQQTPIKPALSDEGRANAIAYGKKVLNGNRLPMALLEESHEGFSGESNHDDSVVYLGDVFTIVLYEEEGFVYDMIVLNDD